MNAVATAVQRSRWVVVAAVWPAVCLCVCGGGGRGACKARARGCGRQAPGVAPLHTCPQAQACSSAAVLCVVCSKSACPAPCGQVKGACCVISCLARKLGPVQPHTILQERVSREPISRRRRSSIRYWPASKSTTGGCLAPASRAHLQSTCGTPAGALISRLNQSFLLTLCQEARVLDMANSTVNATARAAGRVSRRARPAAVQPTARSPQTARPPRRAHRGSPACCAGAARAAGPSAAARARRRCGTPPG